MDETTSTPPADSGITFDYTADGIACFKGPHKIAVITQKDDQGLVEKGQMKLRKMGRHEWTIHFTSPHMNLHLLEAIVAAVPKAFAERA